MKAARGRIVARMLAVAVFNTAALPDARAGVIPTTAGEPSARIRVADFIERRDVAAQLRARGVSAEQAKARVAALTDAEIEGLAAKIDHAPAGAGYELLGLAFLGIVLVLGLVAAAVVAAVRAVAQGASDAGKSRPE
jgi:hypothetical protein